MGKISDEDIFKKFRKYSYKDIEPVAESIEMLLEDSINVADSLKDTKDTEYLLTAIQYATYNKGIVMKEHNLEMLLFNGHVDDDAGELEISWICKRYNREEIWSGSYILEGNVSCVNQQVKVSTHGETIVLDRYM